MSSTPFLTDRSYLSFIRFRLFCASSRSFCISTFAMLPSSSSTTMSMARRTLSSASRVESVGIVRMTRTFCPSMQDKKSLSRRGTYSGFMTSLKKPSYKSFSPFAPVHRSRNSSRFSFGQPSNRPWSVPLFRISASTIHGLEATHSNIRGDITPHT